MGNFTDKLNRIVFCGFFGDPDLRSNADDEDVESSLLADHIQLIILLNNI